MDILDTFRWAQWGLKEHPEVSDDVRRRLTFDGFEESGHFAYAQFVHAEKGLWAEQKGVDFNSHARRLGRYRTMVVAWKQIGQVGEAPQIAELERVAKAIQCSR